MVKIQKFVYIFFLRKNLLAGSKLNSEAWDILDLLRNLDFKAKHHIGQIQVFKNILQFSKKSEGIMAFSYYGENLFSCCEKLKKKKKHERSLITQLNCQESWLEA